MPYHSASVSRNEYEGASYLVLLACYRTMQSTQIGDNIVSMKECLLPGATPFQDPTTTSSFVDGMEFTVQMCVLFVEMCIFLVTNVYYRKG
jgi:hypothetical protein